MHIILRQNISWVTLFMQEGACPITTFILARHPFQEKLAVFRPSKWSMHQPSIEHILVDWQYGYRCFLFGTVSDIGRKACALVFTLKCLLLVDKHWLNPSILAKVLKPPQRFFFGHTGRNPDDIKRVLLQNPNLPERLLHSLVFWCSSLFVLAIFFLQVLTLKLIVRKLVHCVWFMLLDTWPCSFCFEGIFGRIVVNHWPTFLFRFLHFSRYFGFNYRICLVVSLRCRWCWQRLVKIKLLPLEGGWIGLSFLLLAFNSPYLFFLFCRSVVCWRLIAWRWARASVFRLWFVYLFAYSVDIVESKAVRTLSISPFSDNFIVAIVAYLKATI